MRDECQSHKYKGIDPLMTLAKNFTSLTNA